MRAASYADVLWKFGDIPIPLVEESHNLNCSDLNSTLDENVVVTYNESYVSSYISRHKSVMHICNASINNTGEYRCVVEYLHGEVTYTVGSFHLDVTPDIGKKIIVFNCQVIMSGSVYSAHYIFLLHIAVCISLSEHIVFMEAVVTMAYPKHSPVL